MIRKLSLAMIALAVPSTATAQLNGANLLGDTGVRNGSQPAPGFYLGGIYASYETDTIRDADGNRVMPDPTGEGSQTIHAYGPMAVYVSPARVFGANLGGMVVVPFGDGSLEAPGLGLSEEVSTGLADLYVMPFQLGWHFRRADVTTALAFFAPTGRYEAGATDNIGKGMWSYEVSAGSTFYFDQAKSWSLAATGFWEFHSEKEGEIQLGMGTLPAATVGQIVTFEGGLAKSFFKGAAHVGVAGYAQWKVTADKFDRPDFLPDFPELEKHRVFAVGPDVTLPLVIHSKLVSLLNARLLWESGARVKTEGTSFLITLTLPIPGIPTGD